MDKTKKIRTNYSNSDLQDAISSINDGENMFKCSKRTGIPYSTLRKKLTSERKGKYNFPLFSTIFHYFSYFLFSDIEKPGPKAKLDALIEEELLQWVTNGQRYGQPRSTEDIKFAAWALSAMHNCEDVFGENGPTRGYVRGFLRRHPSLVPRKAEKLSRASAAVNVKDVKNWFETVLQSLHEDFGDVVEGLLNDPSRNWNADETGLEMSACAQRVYAAKGSKNVHVVENSKDRVSALFAFSAAGQVAKPFVVFKGARITETMRNTADDCHVVVSANGWMTNLTFLQFIEAFHKEVVDLGVELPVILSIDGHTSHISYEVRIILQRVFLARKA